MKKEKEADEKTQQDELRRKSNKVPLAHTSS
jgi:hypothetical protein